MRVGDCILYCKVGEVRGGEALGTANEIAGAM